MEYSLARYIWKNTWRQQVWILVIVFVSMIPYFLSFDLPKQIVNGPIQGNGFEQPGATRTFMKIAFDVPLFGHVKLFNGVQLDRTTMLFALSFVFLGLVVINGLFKFYINTYKGRLGERMLRRIRFELVDRVLRFPPGVFKRVKAAEVATMVKDEVEPLGGFIGDAFVQPALLGGQALTALVFIVLQNFWLGAIAVAIVAVQAVIIPRMRKRLIRLGRERQLTARELSGRVGEIVDGIGTIHIHDTSNYERADIAARLGRIFKIRYDLYQWKFLVKFLNNFLASVTPFLFYAIGGYQALKGNLDIGQLVAVIAAYKDLPGPLKDLIDWDQQRQDVQVKYQQVVEQFSVETIIDPRIQAVTPDRATAITEPLGAVNVSLVDDSGARILERVSLQIKPGETLAVVGTAASGAEAFAEGLARLAWPESGRFSINDHDILDIPESVTGRRISYSSSDVVLFQGTLGDNLFYGLKHAPFRTPEMEGTDATRRKWEMDEAQKAGNPVFDIMSDWIDYEAAGATGRHDLIEAIRPVLDATMLSHDIVDLALRSSVDPSRFEALVSRMVELRTALRHRLNEEGLSSLVVPFEPHSYNTEATIGENLRFGTATGPALSDKALASNPYVMSVLKAAGLDQTFYEMGLEIASNAVELFADLAPDNPLFQQLTFMAPEDIPAYQALLQRLQGKSYDAVSEEDRARIITLSFAYIEPRHRFGLLTPELMTKIVEARNTIYEGLPPELQGALERYDPTRFAAAASLMDNVLFGRIGHQHADGPERIRDIVRDLIDKLGLYDDVLGVGMDFNVGSGGRRLTVAQRQKIDVARALIKRADYEIFNRPMSVIDQRVQDQILRNILKLEEARPNGQRPAIIWVLSNPAMSQFFDRVVVFDRGMLAEDGTHEALATQNGIFKGLLA
ncbi:ABC transporter transmembrane domain-containing protein [Mesorhizobium sp. BAC0120]|uniref:ABC transporter transmembrane domain-containing protein n=1 Tax=Mesorhizobium sp. BAC0120 TaxID=3090670 RepID=UPI00298C2256|nr:ABC transporter transmembrane domain-containing protein [Mesorhizobium sp. BAC0120]MDW6025605.1 ABC transporter transmembrane domain-containing protein [Mesorhizobium sp. BAC0120]